MKPGSDVMRYREQPAHKPTDVHEHHNMIADLDLCLTVLGLRFHLLDLQERP